MTAPFIDAMKKEDAATGPAQTQANGSSENVEAKLEQDQKKEEGEHGKDFCCGSCS